MAKGPLAVARREARTLCSRITLTRGEYACIGFGIVEGCTRKATDAMHVLAVGAFENLRFVLLNLLPGCRNCHDELKSATLAGESLMRDLFVARHGDAGWNELVTLASKRGRPVRDVLEDLRAQAKALGIR